MAVVALAGPAMNFFLAWCAALLFPSEIGGPWESPLISFLSYFMLSNVVLGLFNLLPIPPLDGGRIAVGLLPLSLARALARLERAGIFIVLLVVFLLPRLTGIDPVGVALDRLLPQAFRLLFWLAGHDVGSSDGGSI
jgi:Zn-dependent protease